MDKIDLNADLRVEDWFWMGSVYYPSGILLMYLTFTFYLGPYIMALRNNQPFENVIAIVRAFNYVNTTVNLGLGISLVYFTCRAEYSILCQPIRPTGDFERQIARCIWLFHVLKVIELIETAFIILRAQPVQAVNGFHVYHHATIVMMTWLAVKCVPGGSTVYPVIMSCLVHVIIFVSFHIQKHFQILEQYQPFVTRLLVVQFSILAAHSLWITLGPGCGYSRWASGITFAYMLSFGVMYSFAFIISKIIG